MKMGVIVKRGSLEMDKEKAVSIAAELIKELEAKLQKKKSLEQKQIIKKKIGRIRKARDSLKPLTNVVQIKKYIGIIFDYFNKHFPIGRKERKQILSKLRKHNERLRNKKIEHKECTVYVSMKNKKRINKRIANGKHQTENDVINKLFERSEELSKLEKRI